MAFEGFSKEAVGFLKKLEKNNEREWFHEHKKVYEQTLKAPGIAFIEAMHVPLKKAFGPDVQAVAKVGGSMFRQHRDTRFSKDKSPYKTHFDMFFWEGTPEKSSWVRSGFMLRITGKEVMLGGGIHTFDKDAMARYRAAVDDAKAGPVLAKACAADAPRRIPAALFCKARRLLSCPSWWPRRELLKHKGLTAFTEMKTPDALFTKSFVPFVIKEFKKISPIHTWLNDHVVPH